MRNSMEYRNQVKRDQNLDVDESPRLKNDDQMDVDDFTDGDDLKYPGFVTSKLFGGAIRMRIPKTFEDVSAFRQVNRKGI